MRYSDKDVQTAFNFLNDTFLKYMPPEINEYAFERALNRLRRELTGKKWQAGHSRKDAADWWWFGGDEVAGINPQLGDLNREQFFLDKAFQAAMRGGNYDEAQKIMDEMVQKGMRSSMVDDYGELIFYGATPKKGKFAGGGLIKKGLKKLLDSTAFNQSRRKFLKQSGAAVAAAGVPKSLLKGAATLAQASSKLPLKGAVPWVKTMTNMLKDVVDTNVKNPYISGL